MISQEIKLYDEPVTNYTPTAQQTNLKLYGKFDTLWTQKQITNEIVRAATQGIKIGNKYKYPHSQAIIKIIGFETQPSQVETDGSECAFIRGERPAAHGGNTVTFMYSIEEINGMIQVND